MSMLNFEHFVTARAELCRSLAQRRLERFGRTVSGPQFDHEAMLLQDPEDPPAPPIVFHLIYQDAKGDLSGRCVTLRSVRQEVGEIRLGTLCHWRKAYRSFVASRVVEATDLATGEVTEDGLDYFARHPLLRTDLSGSNLSLETLAIQECRDELILLTFVAASDAIFDEDECNEIVKHVFNRCPDDLDEREIRRRVRNFVPDEWAFERALSRLCAGSGDPKTLMHSLRHVVDADGELDPEEVAFVDHIERHLRAAGRLS